MEDQQQMKSIWFFVGITLLAMGVLVFVAGILMLISPPTQKTVLWELHPNIWWGGIMMIFGALFFGFNNRKKKSE